MKQPSALHHTMALRLPGGSNLDISVFELFGLVLSRQGIGFIGLTMVLMLLSDPPNLLLYMSMPTAAVIWVLAFGLYLGGMFLVMSGTAYLQKHGRLRRVPSPLLGLIVIPIDLAICETVLQILVGPEYPLTIFKKFIFYYLIGQILEYVFLRWILPTLRSAPDTEPEAEADKAQEEVLYLGANPVPLSEIYILEAQEHFVRAVTKTEEIVHRARLSDLVHQLDPSHGFQPHRSFWVSRYAKPQMERLGAGKMAIRLPCGTQFPVARGRISDVEQWFEERAAEG